MEGEVKEIIELEKYQYLDSINDPIANAGKFDRDDTKEQNEKSPGKFEYRTKDNKHKFKKK